MEEAWKYDTTDACIYLNRKGICGKSTEALRKLLYQIKVKDGKHFYSYTRDGEDPEADVNVEGNTKYYKESALDRLAERADQLNNRGKRVAIGINTYKETNG